MSLGFRIDRHRLLFYCLLYSKLLLLCISFPGELTPTLHASQCQAKVEAQKVASYRRASSIVGSSFVPAFLPCFPLLFTSFSSVARVQAKHNRWLNAHPFDLKLADFLPTDSPLVLLAAACCHLHGYGTIRRSICILACLLHVSRRHFLLLLLPFVFLFSSPLMDHPGPCPAILLKGEVNNKKE